MKKVTLTYPSGATPLAPEEQEELIPHYITTQAELNELEHQNIQSALQWIRLRKKIEVLDLPFIYELHKQMFGQVWRWAGKARKSGKNIGIEWSQISTQTAHLIADTKYWLENKTFPISEIAVRFHHRLVQIHVFPNGNGRHARLITDLLLESRGAPPFTWGEKNSRSPLESEGSRREDYIAALRAADRNEIKPLLQFVCS